MGCEGSKSAMVKQFHETRPETPEEKVEKRTVTFKEPEYTLLKSPLPDTETENIKVVELKAPPAPPRKVKSALFQRSPLAGKVPASAGSRPFTPRKIKPKPEIPEVPLPAARPPRTKRKDLFSDPDVFAKIDKYALAVC